MKTLLEDEKIKLFPKKENIEDKVIKKSYLETLEKLDENDQLVEEPPAWHEAIVDQRYEEWMEGKIESQHLEEVIKELKTELQVQY